MSAAQAAPQGAATACRGRRQWRTVQLLSTCARPAHRALARCPVCNAGGMSWWAPSPRRVPRTTRRCAPGPCPTAPRASPLGQPPGQRPRAGCPGYCRAACTGRRALRCHAEEPAACCPRLPALQPALTPRKGPPPRRVAPLPADPGRPRGGAGACQGGGIYRRLRRLAQVRVPAAGARVLCHAALCVSCAGLDCAALFLVCPASARGRAAAEHVLIFGLAALPCMP